MLDIRRLYYEQVDSLRTYFIDKELSSPLHMAICGADNRLSPLDLKNRVFCPLDLVEPDQQKIDEWKSKTLHGKHVNYLWQPFIDLHLSNKWLCVGDLFSETEGFVCAIQDGVVPTRNYRKHILKERVEDDLCRKCGSVPESLDHIISSFSVMAPREYLNRHNAICKESHQNFAFKHGLISKTCPIYQYKPTTVLENTNFRMYWDRQVYTDRPITHNKPNNLLVDRSNDSAYLIDVAIPHNGNIEQKYA
ncbi:uncharacterized protein LOC119666061 [Teleopsis dalmanni]|uniref:uncharacterized protein LOC119666061 n=1 Tax=Teleopsis dalmanni TaxID=139649 RepID=UPI0018CC9508|nr:uncharacterized protein LOC119666061 [Teleopsis dalmanni]